MIALSGIMDRTLREQPGRGTCEGLVALAVILAALFYYVPVRHTDQYLERHRGRFVAGVALGVAWFLYVHPEVWLMFDGGFRVWAWLGYAVPPFIDAAGPWDLAETSTWLRDGDVVVATGTKSGTTWMLYTSHLIRTRADATQFPFLDPMYNTPWMELQQRPGQTWAERKAAWNTTRVPVHWNAPQGSDYAGEKDGDYAGEQDGMKCRDDDSGQTVRLQCLWDHAAYPFRIFKSHLTPRVSSGLPSGLPSGLLSDVFQAMQTGSGFLPVRERPAVKFVAMVRNGLDVVASRIPFHEAHSAQFRSMWGGFPPRAGTEATVEEAAEARLADLLPGGVMAGAHFEYVKQWWAFRFDPNVLLLHYSDAVADPKTNIRRLAAFFGVNCTAAEVDRIAHLTSLESMKHDSLRFSYRLPLNPHFQGTVLDEGSMTRKGGVGGGAAVFTEDQKRRWAAAEETYFNDPELLAFARRV